MIAMFVKTFALLFTTQENPLGNMVYKGANAGNRPYTYNVFNLL